MKLHLLSDLHIEFEDYRNSIPDCDAVVLAGDIHTKHSGVKWAIENIKHIPVIYVLGNHEYYGKTYPKLAGQLKTLAEGTNVHVLENDVLTLDGVNFLGCTLWTDFELLGYPRIAGYKCQQAMNDYKKIKRLPNYSKIRSIDVAVIHKRSRKWLEENLVKLQGQKNVVVTHHAPSIQSIPALKHSDIHASAYASNLEDIIVKYEPAVWLHGHLHNSSDYQINNCRVLANPRGYVNENNPAFDSELVFEI